MGRRVAASSSASATSDIKDNEKGKGYYFSLLNDVETDRVSFFSLLCCE